MAKIESTSKVASIYLILVPLLRGRTHYDVLHQFTTLSQ
jgi:hypothetical protein